MSKYKVFLHGAEYGYNVNSLGTGNDILGKCFLCVKDRDGRDAYVNMDYVDLIVKDGEAE